MTNSSSSADTFFHDHMHFSQTDQLAISITALLLGAVICFFGKKIFKIFLFVVGFAAISAMTYYVLLTVEHKNSNVHFSRVELLAIPIAAGFIGGCIVLGVLKLGLFLVGALVGTVLSFMIFAAVGNHFGPHAFIIRLVIMGTFALVCGCVVLHQEKKLIILMSSIGGSYSMFAGADHWVKSGYSDAIEGVFDNDTLPKGSTKLYVMLGATLVVAVVGMAFQLLMDKRRKKNKSGWESDPLIGRVNY